LILSLGDKVTLFCINILGNDKTVFDGQLNTPENGGKT